MVEKEGEEKERWRMEGEEGERSDGRELSLFLTVRFGRRVL